MKAVLFSRSIDPAVAAFLSGHIKKSTFDGIEVWYALVDDIDIGPTFSTLLLPSGKLARVEVQTHMLAAVVHAKKLKAAGFA